MIQVLPFKPAPPNSDNRIKAVISGQVDLECGSTTSILKRKKVVDFSPIIFTVVGDFLSYDPYGIMFRKNDPQLTEMIRIMGDDAATQ